MSIFPIKEDRVLESLCQSTNIEVNNMKGSTVSVSERKKLFNKFQRHSETEVLFQSEHNLNAFVSNLYNTGPDRNSELSIVVPNRQISLPCRSNSVEAKLARASQTSRASTLSKQQQTLNQRISATSGFLVIRL